MQPRRTALSYKHRPRYYPDSLFVIVDRPAPPARAGASTHTYR